MKDNLDELLEELFEENEMEEAREELLSCNVSLVHNYRDTKTKSFRFGKVLELAKHEQFQKIRNFKGWKTSDDPEKRDYFKNEIKSKIPCFMITTYGDDGVERLQIKKEVRNPYIIIDIDHVDTDDKDLFQKINSFPFVLGSGVSISGTGFWSIVKFSKVRVHSDSEFKNSLFTQLKEIYSKEGLEIDEACNDTTRLRVLSPYDFVWNDEYKGEFEPVIHYYAEIAEVEVKVEENTSGYKLDGNDISISYVEGNEYYRERYSYSNTLYCLYQEAGYDLFKKIFSDHPNQKELDSMWNSSRNKYNSGTLTPNRRILRELRNNGYKDVEKIAGTCKNKISVQKYLSEASEKIQEFLEENQFVFMVAGCGLGKSYFVKNVLMKNQTVLNVNFLNILNKQNFSNSYREGRREAESYDGSESISINVHNLKYITDEAIQGIDILVIDEIQELWFSSGYRKEAGDSLKEQIGRFQKNGAKIIVMTGTPIVGSDFIDTYDFQPLEVEKEAKEEKDEYEITFIKNLGLANIDKFVKAFTGIGKTIVILSDEHRPFIRTKLSKAGIGCLDIQSPDKGIKGTATNYIVENQKLPDYCDCYLSTSVMVGGINLVETKEEKEIIYVSFVSEIGAPHRAIQFAGRSREQKKKLCLGYSGESEFNLNFTKYIYTNLETVSMTETNKELDRLLSSSFNEMYDWECYINTICGCKVKKNTFSEDKLTQEKIKSTDWKAFAKELRRIKKNDRTFTDYFKIKSATDSGDTRIIKSPSGRNMWAFCTNVSIGKNIVSAMDLGFKIEDLDEAVIKVVCDLVSFSKTFNFITNYNIQTNKNSSIFSGLRDDVENENINGSTFEAVFNKVFGIKKIVNGKEELVDMDHAERRKISTPLKMINLYKKTFCYIIRETTEYNCFFLLGKTPEEIINYDPNKFILEEYNNIKLNTGNKKGNKNASKKIVLVNTKTGEKHEFNSSKESMEYARKTLGFSRDKARLLNKQEIDNWIRE